MAIQIRRGKESQFVPSQLLPGEFAVTTDTGRVYLCWASGHVKELASVEELQRMLDLSDDALDALKEIISTLGGESAITGLLNDIDDLKSDVAVIQEQIEQLQDKTKDLKTGAYHTVWNGLGATSEGYVLDARQGKELKSLVDNKPSIAFSGIHSVASGYRAANINFTSNANLFLMIYGNLGGKEFCIRAEPTTTMFNSDTMTNCSYKVISGDTSNIQSVQAGKYLDRYRVKVTGNTSSAFSWIKVEDFRGNCIDLKIDIASA